MSSVPRTSPFRTAVPLTTAVVAAGFVGTATGLRSQMGMAAVVLGGGHRLPGLLRSPKVRVTATVAALAELGVDKLPDAPNRTEPPGLLARLVLGGLAGGLTTRVAGAGTVPGAIVGSAAALGATFAGLAARTRLSGPLPAPVVAVGEDLVSIGLARLAVRLVTP